MAEYKESEHFTKSYTDILRNIRNYNLNAESYDNYVSLLSTSILQEIEDSKKVPMYAFRMILRELICYEKMDREGYILDLMCTFEPIEKYLPDLIVGNSYILPSSARSTFDTSNGENIVTLSWREYFVKSQD